MSDTSANPSIPPRGSNRPRGDFRRNRPDTNSQSTPHSDRARGGRRGGRNPRGGRGRGSSFPRSMAMGPVTETGQPPGLGGGGTSSVRPTGDASNTEGEEKGRSMGTAPGKEQAGAGKDEEVEAEVCFICASPVEHNSVAPCNHRTCHICALRLRALYKNKLCAHCRTEAEYVIFTDDASKRYEDYVEQDFARKDDNLGIKYEKDVIFEDTVLLLRYNCPDKDCDVACLGWPDLHRHVRNIHHKVMCDLCTRSKKVFTHEHELFTPASLRKHEKFGDDNPGAVDQSGFKGHPECGFCRIRFYGDDELYVHCRDRHERCHICDRRNQGRQQQYYANYEALEEHFRKDHFPCFDPECQEKKFVVFESEMDLKAHQLEAHPNGLSKDARRDARRIDISSFDYRPTYHQPGRRDRGAGRGRDPTAEPLPQSSAQPLSRAELAYQRQMAIQTASQSIAPRTFGGQLTQTVQAPRQPSPLPSRATTPPLPSVSNLTIDANSGTPQDRARAIAHSGVVNRASALLNHNPTKLSTFRTLVSSYRSGSLSASDLITSFFALFDVTPSELGKLVQELAQIYESDTKLNDLLRAWNDWRAINEDYPSLPGAQTSSSAPASGRRVLRLKSSTAQSSRSAVSRQASWGLSSATTSSSNNNNNNNSSNDTYTSNPITNPFPALPAPTNGPSKPTTQPPSRPLPWGSAPPPTSTPSSQPPSRTPSRPSSTHPTPSSVSQGTEAFPALPAAAKPNTLMAGLTRGSVRWTDPRNQPPVTNAWGAAGTGGGSTTTGTTNSVRDDDTDVLGTGTTTGLGTSKKAGKNKGKKQVLYSFG